MSVHAKFSQKVTVVSVKEARERTAILKREAREQFERDVKEADKIRARAILEELESRKLISSNRRANS